MNNTTLALPKDRQEIMLIAQLHAYEEKSVCCAPVMAKIGDSQYAMKHTLFLNLLYTL